MRFKGCLILLCEDEPMIAIDLEEALRQEGATVLGPVTHREQAHDLLTLAIPHAALLDILLVDGDFTDVAEILASEGVPIKVISVLSRPDQLPPALANARWFTKPFSTSDVIDCLASSIEARSSKPPSPPRS